MRPQFRARLIRDALADNKLDSFDMAKAFGISERTWWNWMKEPEKHLTVERLLALAEMCHMEDGEVVDLVRGRRKGT